MKKKVVAAVVAVVVGTSHFSVYAESLTDVKKKQGQVEEDKAKAQEKVNELTVESTKLAGELKNIDSKLSETTSKVTSTKAGIEKTKKEIELLQQDIVTLENRIARRLEILKNRAISFQQHGGSVSYLNIILGSNNFSDFINRVNSVSIIMESDQNIMRLNEEDLNLVEKNKQQVSGKLADNEKRLVELQGIEATLQEQSVEKERIVAALLAEKKETENEIGSLEEQESFLKQQEVAIKQAQAEAERKAKEEADRIKEEANKPKPPNNGGNSGSGSNGGGSAPPITSGAFMRPANGPISSEMGDGRGHKGMDISKGGASVVPIVASADGVVIRSDYSPSYGEVIYLSHHVNGQTFTTVYAHMESGSRRVSSGQVVSKGQQIGLMGNTGQSYGAHLHFELHEGPWNASKSNAVNPRKYINF